jgi:hypothetical protein
MENGWNIAALDDLKCRHAMVDVEPAILTVALKKLGNLEAAEAEGHGGGRWNLDHGMVSKVTASILFRSQSPIDKVNK